MENLTKIGNVVPQVNGYCYSSSPSKVSQYIQFKIQTKPSEYFPLSQQPNALKTKTSDGGIEYYTKENLDYMPNKDTSCCTQNFPFIIGSYNPFTLEINWDDGTVQTIEATQTTSSGYTSYVVQFRLYNTEYFNGNGQSTRYNYTKKSDGSNYIPEPPHVFQDGQIKNRNITFNVTKGSIHYFYAYHVNFDSFPVFSVPNLEYIHISECTTTAIPLDVFKYLKSLKVLDIGYNVSNQYKIDKIPDDIFNMDQLESLQLNSLLKDTNPEKNGMRNINKLKNLKSLEIFNCCKYYIPEFNELSNLYYLNMGTDIGVYTNIFSKYNITTLAPKLTNFSFIYNWNGGTKSIKDGWGYPLGEVDDASLARLTILRGFGGSMDPDTAPFGTWNRMTRLNNLVLNQQWPLSQYGSTSASKIEATIEAARVPIDKMVKNLFVNVIANNISMLTNSYGSWKSQWRGMNVSLYRSQMYKNRLMRPSGDFQSTSGFELGKSNGLIVNFAYLDDVDSKTGTNIDYANTKVLRQDGTEATSMEMLYCLVKNYSWKILVNGDATGLEENNAGAYPQDIATLTEDNVEKTIDYTIKSFIYLDVTDKDHPIMIAHDNYGLAEFLGMDNVYVQGFESDIDAKEWCREQNIEWNDTEI